MLKCNFVKKPEILYSIKPYNVRSFMKLGYDENFLHAFDDEDDISVQNVHFHAKCCFLEVKLMIFTSCTNPSPRINVEDTID